MITPHDSKIDDAPLAEARPAPLQGPALLRAWLAAAARAHP